MRKGIIWFAIAIMVLMASKVNATYPEDMFGLSGKSQQQLQQKAQKELKEFRKLNAQIPTLSPAEQSWLWTEYDDEIARAGNRWTKRALAATNTKEYDLRLAKPHVEQIIKVLSQLSRPSISDQRSKVILWAKLASLYMDYGFWQAIEGLVQKGIVDKKINGREYGYYINHAEWARGIINVIVIGYLNGNLDK